MPISIRLLLCHLRRSGISDSWEETSLAGPKQIDTDLSITKAFPITEGQSVEFRAEFFNLFNNVNFDNPINIASSGNFGQIVDTTTGPRVIQFALKYTF